MRTDGCRGNEDCRLQSLVQPGEMHSETSQGSILFLFLCVVVIVVFLAVCGSSYDEKADIILLFTDNKTFYFNRTRESRKVS